MKTLFTPLVLGMAILASGCASTYNSIRPEAIKYDYMEPSPDGLLSIGYQYDVLAQRGNKKYVKRELKHGVKVVAVKVVNNSSEAIHIGRDTRLFLGDREMAPMDPYLTAKVIKQGVPIYLLYLLLNVTVGATQNPQTQELEGGTFIPTGPFIAGGNMIVAASANSKMQRELTGENLYNKTVGPGESVYGIICLRESNSSPLRIQFKN